MYCVNCVDPGDRASSIVYEGGVGFHAIIISFILFRVRRIFRDMGYGNLTYTGYTGGNICIYSSVVSSCIFVLRPSHLVYVVLRKHESAKESY